MQEQVDVQWDLRSIDSYASLTTRIYVCILLVCGLWGVISLIRLVWATYAWPSTRRRPLLDLFRALRSSDINEVSKLAREIPETAPEGGLRTLALKKEPPHDWPADIVQQGQIHFKHALLSLRNTAANLRNLIVLLSIVTASAAADGLANLCKGTAANKAAGISALFAGLSELLGLVWISLLVIAGLYSIRWRIVSVITNREHRWELLKSRLELFLNSRR